MGVSIVALFSSFFGGSHYSWGFNISIKYLSPDVVAQFENLGELVKNTIFVA